MNEHYTKLILDPDKARYMAEAEKPYRDCSVASERIAHRIGKLMLDNPSVRSGLDLRSVWDESWSAGDRPDGQNMGHLGNPLEITLFDVYDRLSSGDSRVPRRVAKFERRRYLKDAKKHEKRAGRAGTIAGQEYDSLTKTD